MFRLFFFVMFAPLFVFGCSGFDADPISVISVFPPDRKVVDVSELDRVYGKLRNTEENSQQTETDGNGRYISTDELIISGCERVERLVRTDPSIIQIRCRNSRKWREAG